MATAQHGLQCCDIIYGGNGESQLAPERNAIGHTPARASSEHAWDPIASSSAKCRKPEHRAHDMWDHRKLG
jgi:hypothetical protein